MKTRVEPIGALQELEFDSRFLGGRVYRLTVPKGGDVKHLSRLVAESVDYARARQATLVACRVPVDARLVMEILESAGFRRIERLLTFRRGLAHLPTTPSVRRANRHDADACERLARASFSFDRYHADPRIESSAADAIKGAWAANGVNGRADVAYVAEDRNNVRGFILCLRRGSDAIVDLIAVSSDARRKGIGRGLIAAAIAHYAQAPDVTRITASTQATNFASILLYQSTGFTLAGEAVTYHLTPD
jgi:ribosomal protein S18 acetylase RimI-like enzyme